MLRKVRSSLPVPARVRGPVSKKRLMVIKFAKKFLRLKRDQPLQLQVMEPSQAFLEEDFTRKELDNRLPAEVIYMLRNIRVFGFFDKPLFLELCQQLEFINVPKGKLLFAIGDHDDSMFIVESGKLEVFITESDGSELTLKEAVAGDPIFSLLSVMDVLSGHLAPFKTVSARALEESTVLRLQINIFRDLLEKYPELLVRVVQ
ncbi:Neuropathy target esterase-like protein, partial [Dinothrombium tinctorium]